MDLIFCTLKEAQKTWISFFASLKKLKKHGFGHIFYVVRKILQKTPLRKFFLSLENVHESGLG